jgi:protein-S-isoprenylcysteine O-methyltransferase Ste14
MVLSQVVNITLRHKGETGPKPEQSPSSPIIITMRLWNAVFTLLVVAYVIAPGWIEPLGGRWALPLWLWSLGVASLAGAIVLRAWVMVHFGRRLVDHVAPDQGATLVKEGPFRFVRHPFYLSMCMDTIGGALVISNVLFFVLGLGLVAIIGYRATIEDRSLADTFGDEFTKYRAQTGAVLPSIRSLLPGGGRSTNQ